MKVISLNTYIGHVFEPLMKFIEEQAPSTDIFCFQEMMSSEDTHLAHELTGLISNRGGIRCLK